MKDLKDEIARFLKGKTIDAVAPPLVFVVAFQFLDLSAALVLALIAGVLLFFNRLFKKHALGYALFGLFGVMVAAVFSYVAGTASGFFLPQILGNAFVTFATLMTLIIGKPLAALLSHVSRNFPLPWYWREDVLPAYREVTIMWLVLMSFRVLILTILYLGDDVVSLAWVNTLLGFPVTLLVLALSYVYGMWRLQHLKGPSVDEFKRGDQPPYESQKKGF